MFGKDVRVLFNGKLVTVTVPCEPTTPYGSIKERAISMLKRKEMILMEEESNSLLRMIEDKFAIKF